MKKFSVFAVLGLLMPVCAHAANNNIKMVTYFPIPYVSYNELGVTKTCDLGLMDGCVLDSGSSLLVHKTASDGALRLKEGTLSLNGPLVSGHTFRAGTNTISNSRIEFKHSVDVKSMTQSVQSLEVTNRAYLGELNLFGETFPKCENNNSRVMTWKRLTINGKEGVFLVCGAGEKAACEDKYGAWTATSEMATDTCNGNNTTAFSCGNVAKECVDVKNAGGATFSFTADSLETFVSSLSSVEDTCDGDKTARATAASCRKDGECRDIFFKSKNIYLSRTAVCKQLTKDSYQRRTVTCCGDKAANCDDATYKSAHKQECCPSTPTSDAVCWYWDWYTYSSGGGDCWGGGCGGSSNTCVGSCEDGDTCEWTDAGYDTVNWGGGYCKAYPNGWRQ